MSTTVSGLLASAEFLLQNGSNEADRRACISRAYYAAYHDCKCWHDALPIMGALPAQGGGVHADLIGRLQNPLVRDSEQAKNSRRRAYMLKAMKDVRTKADYQLSDEISSVETEQLLVNAKAVIAIA